ncbi:MAG: chloride channel protein, partial [Aquisalimonadaceae bacterium]
MKNRMVKERAPHRLREWIQLRLSTTDALLLMSMLGILCGALAGGIILAFRWLIEGTQDLYLTTGQENFGVLAAHWRFILPVAGGLLVGLLLVWVPLKRQGVGIAHVMESLSHHQGVMPLRNALVQFTGAAVSIATGHSVGREGPAAHLGAAGGSLIGQGLRLPNNVLRVLVGCGVAAAVAASFNTPLAGVVFAMEVVLMEYTLAGFLPVMLAAVTATVISQLAYGTSPALVVPTVHMESFFDLPWLLLMGVLIGGLAAAFIHSLQMFTSRSARIPIVLRTTLAGVGVGVLGLALPEVMGLGYDTINRVLAGELTLWLLVLLAGAKLLASTMAIGLGIPGGLIGPTVVVGAAAGAAVGHGLQLITPELASPVAFYALVGLGAMMGATLRAPLAALTALLELTYTPGIILPGMLTIAAATICSNAVFGMDSVFAHQLRARGVQLRSGALSQALSRMGVGRLMDRSIVVSEKQVDRATLRGLLATDPHWILIQETPLAEPMAVLPAAALLSHLDASPEQETVDLLGIDTGHLQAATISMRASLRDALDIFQSSDADILCVSRMPAPGMQRY